MERKGKTMGALRFDGKGVVRCLDHAGKLGGELLLVHDDGVYLMSSGLPADVEGMDSTGLARFVVHAEGCNPKVDEGWWERSRDLVGGDDFVAAILLSRFTQGLVETMREGLVDLLLTVSQGQIKINLVPSRALRSKRNLTQERERR
jgi:hypothetical protein